MKVVASKLFGSYTYFESGFPLLRKFLKKTIKSRFWRHLVIHILACFRYTGMYSRLSVSILFANTKQVTCTKNTLIDNLN